VSKRILLIDSDEAFAQGLSHAIVARGFVATTATNSEQGMTMAKAENPDLIVVCVEAQPTNGYMLCTRLKKDEQLKGIPVILTSAHATPDSFEKHKKLKTRAEEYLIKPFEPQVILEKASALMGIRLPPEQAQSEEIVSVEDEPLGLGDLVDGEDEPISLSEQETQAALAPEEPVLLEEVEEVVQVEEHQAGDHDLEMFDKAFDSLGGPTQQPPPKPKAVPDLAEDDTALLELREIPGDGGSLEARVAELEKELLKLKEAKNKVEAQLQEREAAAKTLQQRADALAAAAKKFERELGAAREESKKNAKSAELETLRSEAQALTGEKDLLAEERDELKKQLEEAQVTAVLNEDRAVKAYQKIKSDEKLREKTRKALEIALQLLSEDPSDVTTEVETAKKSA